MAKSSVEKLGLMITAASFQSLAEVTDNARLHISRRRAYPPAIALPNTRGHTRSLILASLRSVKSSTHESPNLL
ncbi:hypothetical protein DOTSEDRAFT_71107 [Dothistroma septosporum NZE10]|uniref:Uncharacterized protein n=1 Tax=Dothistroma septosporum (strain NZE10 / CBS 128990) TaxID=675120 RepID=N1PS89_DOTSN|nr:hypothetical protein DOTSEDRAFT_71107 [Dothistroma septosporum NZE10]